MKKVYSISLFFLLALTFTPARYLIAQTTETFGPGSYIINMGLMPQTVGNGLKPYGLVYELMKTHSVPVKWIISQTKAKDGVDFVHEGVQYRGSAFIVPGQFRTTEVNNTIANWEAQGVVGATTTSNLTVEVYQTLRIVPQWTLDKQNGRIAADYFINAGIPPEAHGGADSDNWKNPADLGACDDIFVMPHADPTWETHKNLYYWNRQWKGNIWAACHAVSVLESLQHPDSPLVKMNFLTTRGLILFNNHAPASPTYSYLLPNDPIQQYMAGMDYATDNGSERVFLPLINSAWRNTAKVYVYDPSQVDVPVNSPGYAAITVYGRAFGDENRGWVMYQAGHDHDRSTSTMSDKIAAQRAFFNFSLVSNNSKSVVDIDFTPVPAVLVRGDTMAMSFNVPEGIDLSNYSLEWTSSCGGSFYPANNIRNTSFIVPADNVSDTCVISVKITDGCSRINFASKGAFVSGGILHLKLGRLSGQLNGRSASLQWMCNGGAKYFLVEKSKNGRDFIAAGTVNVTGNLALPGQYSFSEADDFSSGFYYRIKAVGIDEKITTSNSIFLSDKTDFHFSILPNPVNSSSVASIYSENEQVVKMYCYDITGKTIFQKQQRISSGTSNIDIREIKKLKPGIYIYKVYHHSGSAMQRITVF